jgi:tetratricopeptide (TPR) repeat protein
MADGEVDRPLERARELNHLGRHEQALQVLAASDPMSVRAHCERAVAYQALGRHQEAFDAAAAAARLAPALEWPHRLCAVALLALRRLPEGLRAARIAARVDPSEPRALMVLAEAQVACRELDQAHATASELVRLAPGLGLSHATMARVAMASEDWRGAEAANRAALRLDPEDSAAMNNLAVALQRLGRHREALELYQEAARIDPADEVARRNIVGLLQPASGSGCLSDALLAVTMPLALPVILGRYALRFVRAWRLRQALRPGPRSYYERVVWGGGAIRWDAVAGAGALFMIGYVGLAIAQGRGWHTVDTGGPIALLAAGCAAIAGIPTAAWAVRRVAARRRR